MPLLTAVHVAPPSVLSSTPWSRVATNRTWSLPGSMEIELAWELGRLVAENVIPPSLLLTSLPVETAQSVAAFCGSAAIADAELSPNALHAAPLIRYIPDAGGLS